ncbi:MAG: type III pantothenate kinase [Bacteriovoracales bacterium]
MKTIYTIDNGNTNPHVGIFKEGHLEKVVPLKDCQFNEANAEIILSSVGRDINLSEKKIFNVKDLKSEKKFLDMPVDYSASLGMDRLACAYWVFKNRVKNEEKVLLIDAGTFTTYDLISKKGHEGGFIFPGLQTFLKTYAAGANLPILDLKNVNLRDEVNLPHCTEDAIGEAAKVYFQMTFQSLLETFKPGLIITTGGEGKYFSEACFIPHLIHMALFEIRETVNKL